MTARQLLPGEVGRAVASLASDDMSYLIGATVMLNGGRVLLS